jgi:predicted molibdopterin-dependent oxidoreductase YjgC
LSVEQERKSISLECDQAFDVPIFILDLIENFIKANASIMSVTVEDDRLNRVLNITIKDSGPGHHPIPDGNGNSQLSNSRNTMKNIDVDRLRDAVDKAGGIFNIGRSESGETTVTATIKLSSVKGEMHHDLCAMLSSVVCTNPDLDLTFDFRIGKQTSSIRVSDIKNRLPSEKSGGLTVARAVQEKIKAALEAFEEAAGRGSALNRSICPFCSCGCQVVPRKSARGDLTGLAPLRRHPVSNGSLCIRGWNSYEYLSHSDRLSAPMIRKDGRLTQCAWSEALGKTASDLQSIIQKWGPESVGFIGSPRCSNEDNYLLMKLARCMVGTGNLDASQRLSLFPVLDALFDSQHAGTATASLDMVEQAELILTVGADLTGCAPQVASRIFQALNHKADVIVVDPRSTKLAKRATRHWAVRPGSDLYWINGIISHLIAEKKIDAGFLDRKISGFAALKKESEKYSLSRAESETGIASDSLRHFADRLAEAENAVFILGSGLGDPDLLKKATYGLMNLAFVSGQAEKRGSGIMAVGGENNTQGAWDMGVLPDRLPGGIPIHQCDQETLTRLHFDKRPVAGCDFKDIMRGVLSGEIRGLYVMGENLPAFCEEDKAFMDALGQLDMLAVQEIFPNPMTSLATIVLPALAPYERDGTFTNLERRVQEFEPIVSPRKDARADWEIIQGVAQAMGAGFEYKSASDIRNEIAARVPFYGGMDAQTLHKNTEGMLWPETSDGKNLRPWLQPDWKGILHPFSPEKETGIKPDGEFPVLLIFGRLQSFWNTGVRSSRSPLLNREEIHAALHMHPEDAKEFQLREGWKVNVFHSSGSMQTSVVLTEDLPRGVAFLPAHLVDGRIPLFLKSPVPVRVQSC